MGKLREKLPPRGNPFTCQKRQPHVNEAEICTFITVIFNFMMIIQLFIHTFVIKD